MSTQDPKISFLFPIRWLEEDKEFFPQNVKNMILKEHGKEAYNILGSVPLYRVEVHYQHKEPVHPFPLTKQLAEKALKPFFTFGKCVGVNIKYEQHASQTMLPLCDFRIYF